MLGYWSKNICDFSVQYIILKKAEKSFRKVRLALKSNLKYVPLIFDKIWENWNFYLYQKWYLLLKKLIQYYYTGSRL